MKAYANAGSMTHTSSTSREEFFQHEFPHERSDLSHWRKRLSAPSRSTDGLGVFVEMQTDCTYRHQTVRCGTA
jgi:hypothetical protein